MKKNKKTFRILSPTAILGYGFPVESFRRGLNEKPDLIGVDAGSTDPGPYYLGSGKSFTNRSCVKRDLNYLLTASVKDSIPLVIGTAGGSGAAPHLNWCREIIEEIASENNLSFTLGLISADIDKRDVLNALKEDRIKGLAGVPHLTEKAVNESTRVVAQMDYGPIIRAFDNSCDVILAGRCYDPAVFAALPVREGYDPGLSLHLGKILECAAIASTPGSGSDCVLGSLEEDRFILETLNPKRRFTPESTAAHTLYEKSDPYHLPGPGGSLNLENCTFTDLGDGKVEVRGSRFEPSEQYFVKLEGARRLGFRTISIAGVRDPIMISEIKTILPTVEKQVKSILKGQSISGSIHFHVYGQNGVMGELEPVQKTLSHELGLVLETISPTQSESDTLCSMVRSNLLHYGYPKRISTAGNLAFPFSPSDIPMGEVYEFSIYHLMQTDPGNLFPVEVCRLKPGKRCIL